MPRLLPLLLLAACVAGPGPSTITSTTVAATTTTAASTTTAPLVECPTAPYQLTYLPEGVGGASLDPGTIEPDVWTSVPGSSTVLWGREGGAVAIALIRGTLPAVDWPGQKGEVFVDGTRGVVGPHADGAWVAGWYEQPGARCDLYTMVWYPPVEPAEVESTILGMNRVGG